LRYRASRYLSAALARAEFRGRPCRLPIIFYIVKRGLT